MMYYDRSLPKDSALLEALVPGGALAPLVSWLDSPVGQRANARIELRTNRGNHKHGALQVYIGRNAVLTIVTDQKNYLSFGCHAHLQTDPFRNLPETTPITNAPCADIIGHLEILAPQAKADDEGAVHAGFMRHYGDGYNAKKPIVAVDSEVQIGFESDGNRSGTEIRNTLEATLKQRYQIKGSVPRKLDVLGLDAHGQIHVVELKGAGGDLGQAVVQAAVHVIRFEQLLSASPINGSNISALIRQKQAMGVLPKDLPSITTQTVQPVVAMPDNPDGWRARWLRQSRAARGQLGHDAVGMQFWLLNPEGEIIDTHTIDAAVPQSWDHYVQAQQVAWKQSAHNAPEARQNGYFRAADIGRGAGQDYCLPRDLADYNLLPKIREQALTLFETHRINWWSGVKDANGRDGPTNHVRSSQIHCVNTLLSLHHAGTLLTAVQDLVPDAVKLINVESDQPIGFEWNGADNPLGERGAQRGKYSTSIDAFLVVEDRDGTRTGLFLEWKLTESYDPDKCLRYSSNQTDRSKIYAPAYAEAKADGVFGVHPSIELFHYDPHDQLFRQALLANKVRRAANFRVQSMCLVDCVPQQNAPLRTAVPQGLRAYGDTIDTVWQTLLPTDQLKFMVIDPLKWMHLAPDLNARYGALYQATPPILT